MTGVVVPSDSVEASAKKRRRLKALGPRQFTASRPIRPLVALMGFSALAQLNGLALFLLLPDIKDTYHLGLALASLVVALRIQLGLAFDLPLALTTNRGHRMRITCLGMVAFVVFSVLAAVAGMARGVILLDVATLGIAAAGGAFTSTQNSLLADYYPAEIRSRVYYAHRAAIVAGLSLAPLFVGTLKLFYSWQVVLLVLAAPMPIFIVIGLWAGEPSQGANERGNESAGREPRDEPPTLPETTRVLFANRSLRQIYYSLPFLAAAVIGIQQFVGLFYQNVLHQDASRRNLIFAVLQPAGLIGLIAGMVIVQRRMTKDPGRTVRLIALTGTASALCLIVFATAPNLGWALGAHAAYLLTSSWLVAGIYTIISLLVPPRMLTLGFALSTLWFQFGVALIAPAGLSLAGAVDGRWGFRAGIFLFAALYLLGSAVLRPSGAWINADLAKMRLTALADAEAQRARMEGRTKLLMVRSLDVGYDGVQVLFGVDLDIAAGEIVAILGTNGAGKTTLLRAISGLTVASAGEVLLDGRDITTWEPNRIVESGIIQVPGGRGIFPGLTVAESMRVAGWRYDKDPEHGASVIDEVLQHFPVLLERWHTPAGNLSGGEQQMLSLAQAFIARPRLLMIDELSLGLAPTVIESLLGIVKAFHDQGTTVILVEQSVNLALRLTDRAIFMEKGQVIYSGPTSELVNREDIVRAVFLDGRGGAAPSRVGVGDQPGRATEIRAAAPVVLSAMGLEKRFGGVVAVNSVDLELLRGEILGLIGPNGAGKTTVFDLISGHLSADRGRVVMFGNDITGWSAHRRAANGLARSFQAARLWPGLTVQEAVNLAVAKSVRSPGVVQSLLCLPTVSRAERHITAEADELIESLGLGPYRDLLTSDLSMGTRRLVELAVMIALQPTILLLDEPSAGISQAESEGLVPQLRTIKARLGCSILLIEHDMALMRSLADRIAALDTGEVVAVGSPDEVLHHPRVIESYLGAAAR
ncbi:MAG TPA: MFS transporter [Acidimicrobiales bacterium]|nr:MFS transporter [Acidimicrobiales bacterium]